MSFQEKKAVVLGMGETGLSMAKWLSRRGANVRAVDSRATPPCLEALKRILPQDRLFTGTYPAEAFAGIDLIAISPGVPLAQASVQQAVQDGIAVIGDMELFASAIRQHGASKPIVLGITGSNGKTTVTAMVGAMVKEAGMDVEVAGNIGPAVLNALMRREDSGTLPQAWVLEVSSFQLETTQSLEPDAAVVLNVSEDHFDRYSGMQDYAAAKARIFTGTRDGGSEAGVQILNRDDSIVRAMALAGRRQITFGLDEPASDNDFGLLHESGNTWLAQGQVRLMKTSELRRCRAAQRGECAGGVGAMPGGSSSVASLYCRLCANFRGLPHRMEKVAAFGGITFYDDSKGTNVGATVAALNGMTQSVVLIAGGDGKGQDFSPLAAPIAAPGSGSGVDRA